MRSLRSAGACRSARRSISIQDEDADLLTNSFGVEGLDAYEMMRSLGAAFHAGGIVDVLKAARRFSKHLPSARKTSATQSTCFHLSTAPHSKAQRGQKDRSVPREPLNPPGTTPP